MYNILPLYSSWQYKYFINTEWLHYFCFQGHWWNLPFDWYSWYLPVCKR